MTSSQPATTEEGTAGEEGADDRCLIPTNPRPVYPRPKHYSQSRQASGLHKQNKLERSSTGSISTVPLDSPLDD